VKWIALLVAISAVVPFAGWLRRHPSETPKIWMLVGFLPFILGGFGGRLHFYMAAISWPDWPGYAKGTEISSLDLLALSLLLSQPRNGPHVRLLWPMGLYVVAVLLSAMQATEPMASFFYAFQFARMILLYATIVRGCADPRVVPSILTGMLIGLCFEVLDALWQRFHLGVPQPGGTFGHQNSLGLITHFVVFPWAALLFAGQRGVRPWLGPMAGLATVVLTVSRGAIGLAAVGYGLLYLLSAWRKWTPRKAFLLAGGAMALLSLMPIVISSFEKRFAHDPLSSDYDERAAFIKAARLMITDFPLGVGANSYVVVANTEGYNSKGGVAPIIGSDSANVHNVYFLVAAETGYFGLATYLLMLFRPLIVAFRSGWRYRNDIRGDVLLGLGMSLLMIYVHSCFEWIFITFAPQYLFAIDAGMAVGLATQLGYWRSRTANRVELAAAVAGAGRLTNFSAE
jgi:O-antigen ligase